MRTLGELLVAFVEALIACLALGCRLPAGARIEAVRVVPCDYGGAGVLIDWSKL